MVRKTTNVQCEDCVHDATYPNPCSDCKNKSLFSPKARVIPQAQLTSECWMVQFRGEEACEKCEYANTPNCGGKRIRKTGENEKGHSVPLGERRDESTS